MVETPLSCKMKRRLPVQKDQQLFWTFMDVKEFENFLKGLSKENFISGNIFFHDNFTEIFWADSASENITAQITKPVKQKLGYSADFEISDGELSINYYKDNQEDIISAETFGEIVMDNFFIMTYVSLLVGYFIYNLVLGPKL